MDNFSPFARLDPEAVGGRPAAHLLAVWFGGQIREVHQVCLQLWFDWPVTWKFCHLAVPLSSIISPGRVPEKCPPVLRDVLLTKGWEEYAEVWFRLRSRLIIK